MWLINTDTLKLHLTYETQNIRYAILSHTWGDDEVSFQDFQNLDAQLMQKPGFAKIKATCAIAKSRNIKWAWCDQCCINKESSAELSEAINSMYQWYRDSTICFAYIADLPILPETLTEMERITYVAEKLKTCRWMSRGWTLQELIAPSEVEFFNFEWSLVGTRSTLVNAISSMTNIDEAVLQGTQPLASIPLGRKMSCAANRQTTRPEDRAYSLLGIFGISMPLLYGEGIKAFGRLQRQLVGENNDLSLFAWQYTRLSSAYDGVKFMGQLCGLFAESPDEFQHCGSLKMHPGPSTKEFVLTNAGLRIRNTMLVNTEPSRSQVLLDLDCFETSVRTYGQPMWLGIPLVKIGETYYRERPERIECSRSRDGWVSLGAKSPLHGQKDTPLNTGDGYIKAFLLKSEYQRFSSFSGYTGIVIAYHKNLVQHVKLGIGLPSNNCRERLHIHRHKTEPAFIFDVKSADNFLGTSIVRFQQETGICNQNDVVIVFCTQWDNATSKYRLRWGLFHSADIITAELAYDFPPTTDRVANEKKAQKTKNGSLPKHAVDEVKASALLRSIRDEVFVRYSNLTGMLGDNMPRTLTIPHNDGRQLNLRYVARQRDHAELGSDFPWIDGFHHLFLE